MRIRWGSTADDARLCGNKLADAACHAGDITDHVLVGHGLPTGAAAIDETTIYLIKAKEVFRSAKDKILRDLRGPGCAAHSTLAGIERLTRPLARAFNWARRPSAGSTGGA
jgi:hypothetical protein